MQNEAEAYRETGAKVKARLAAQFHALLLLVFFYEELQLFQSNSMQHNKYSLFLQIR